MRKGPKPRPPIERFTEKYVKKLVVVNGKLLCCWLWTGSLSHGYGQFWDGERKVLAHRWSYMHHVGPIPDDTELDHYRCWTPACVNPHHVRPATRLENQHNGLTTNAVKSHCPRGHAYTVENTYIGKQVYKGTVYPMRGCRACRREQQRARRASRG
jgi:hypothetical protein